MAHAVLTRDQVDTEAYVSSLAQLGLDVVAMPVTRTASAADPAALGRALASHEFALIIVASPRAAHELARAAGTMVLPEVWAVGPATRRALETAKIAAHHPANVRDGADLARVLVATRQLAGVRVLVPRAEDGRVEVLQTLRAAGADVVDVIAYRTVATVADDPLVTRGLELLRAGEVVVCVVFAPSQVAALAGMIPIHTIATRFCAIGETTAAALRATGVVDVAVAPSPTPEGIAQAVRSVYPPGR